MSREATGESIKASALEIADEKIKKIASNVQNDLVVFARKHQRTGELARNITLRKMKTKVGYTIDGGTRASYSNNSYHAITFFLHDKAKKTLTQVLKEARESIK